jgi:SpoVK/Ycf46/Vps4 family AAA+-type ATPase
MLAASASGRAVSVLQAAEVLSMVLGESEKALRRLFAAARARAPAVVVVDQLELLAPVRGFDSSSGRAHDRLLSALLTELDGVRDATDVAIIATAQSIEVS